MLRTYNPLKWTKFILLYPIFVLHSVKFIKNFLLLILLFIINTEK